MKRFHPTWSLLMPAVLGVALMAGVAPDASATRYKLETLSGLVEQSALVLIGTVVGMEYREDAKTGEVFTDVKLRPVRWVIGGRQSGLERRGALTLPFAGGVNAKGQMEAVVGLPELSMGQTYLLFLRGGEWSLNPIAGWSQGALRLVAIDKGEEHVMFDLQDRIVTGLKDGYLAYAPLPDRDGRDRGPGGCADEPPRISLGTQTDLAAVRKRLADSIYREDNVDELQRQDAERWRAQAEDRPRRDRRARMRELLGEDPMTLRTLLGEVNRIRAGLEKQIYPDRWKYHPDPVPGLIRSAPASEPGGRHTTREGQS